MQTAHREEQEVSFECRPFSKAENFHLGMGSVVARAMLRLRDLHLVTEMEVAKAQILVSDHLLFHSVVFGALYLVAFSWIPLY